MKAISLRLLTWIAVLSIGLTQSAWATNAAVDWNKIALTTALTTPGTQVYLTYVNLAMYNAVNAIDRRYELYGPTFRGPRDASKKAAVISAAYQTLLHYFPDQSTALQAQYAAAIAVISDSEAKTKGILVGKVAAATIVAARAGDGRAADVPYSYPTSPVPGVWIPTPPAFAPPVPPWIGQMVPFTMTSAAQFLPTDGPPDLGSPNWTREYNEVKGLGAANSTVRTASQTATGLFWTGNPTVTWYTAFAKLPAEYHLNLSQSARLLAMLSTAFTDSGIGCFNAKFHFSFWRPVTAISNGEIDGNPDTEADAAWLPLASTPPHPEFPAAHTCAAGAIGQTLENFFGTSHVKFTVTNPVTQETRIFRDVSSLERQAFWARIYAGFHYRHSLSEGLKLGHSVAEQLNGKYFNRETRR